MQPTVCNAPAKLNRRGACECPKDMVAKGNGCVERERPQRGVPLNDIIKKIPGGGGRQEPAAPHPGDGDSQAARQAAARVPAVSLRR